MASAAATSGFVARTKNSYSLMTTIWSSTPSYDWIQWVTWGGSGGSAPDVQDPDKIAGYCNPPRSTNWRKKNFPGPVEGRKIFVNGSCIVGDSAFYEGEWMPTPITFAQDRVKRWFDYKHSCMRIRVEHAFGRLKWKFLASQRGLLFKLEDAPIVIDACVILL